MTFKDLRKRVCIETQQQSRYSERLQNKPFWIWNIEDHKQEYIKTNGDCCFNHIIGLPQKDGIDKPLYDYEKIIFDTLTLFFWYWKPVTTKVIRVGTMIDILIFYPWCETLYIYLTSSMYRYRLKHIFW